jgi:hypothetical protein
MKRSNHHVHRTFVGHQHDLVNVSLSHTTEDVLHSQSQYRGLLLHDSSPGL